MTNPFPINLVVEDALSETVLRTLLRMSQSSFDVGACYGKCGYVYIKQRATAFNNAAKGMPYLILVDLESSCPPSQIREWLGTTHPNLLFRVAVKEIESWVLADRSGFASFLGISTNLIPPNPDEIYHPKQELINLARRSRKRQLREAIVPRLGSTARIGPDYNGQLSSFVINSWNIEEAIQNSPSLRRAVHAINNFQPIWESQ